MEDLVPAIDSYSEEGEKPVSVPIQAIRTYIHTRL